MDAIVTSSRDGTIRMSAFKQEGGEYHVTFTRPLEDRPGQCFQETCITCTSPFLCLTKVECQREEAYITEALHGRS